MDPTSPRSVAAALAADGSFGGTCQDSVVEGPFRWGEYSDASGETLFGLPVAADNDPLERKGHVQVFAQERAR